MYKLIQCSFQSAPLKSFQNFSRWNKMRRLLDFHRGSISKAVYQLFLGGLEARICTGIGRPVPLPPHELHRIIPDPSHVLHPTSSSDHLVHMQGTRRDPLHVGHWLNPLMGFSCSASIIDFIIHAPARQLMPCATWVITPGDILQSQLTRVLKKFMRGP